MQQPVHELLETYTSSELVEWFLYFSRFGPDELSNARMGRICQTVVAVHGKRAKVTDFYTSTAKVIQTTAQTREQQIAMFKGLTDGESGNSSN